MKLNRVLFSRLQNSWFNYLYQDIVNELTRYNHTKEIKSIVKVVAMQIHSCSNFGDFLKEEKLYKLMTRIFQHE